jgi:spore maturation protein CgeB
VTQGLCREPLKHLGFEEDTDFIAYSSFSELRDKCAYAIANPNYREDAAESAFQKLQGYYDRFTLQAILTRCFAKVGFKDVAERIQRLEARDAYQNRAQNIRFLGVGQLAPIG